MISKQLQKSFEKNGIDVMTNSEVISVEKKSTGINVRVMNKKKEQKIRADVLLSAVKVDETVEYLLGDQPTTPEGYVLIGPKYSVKLVNRLEFSQANFNLRKNSKNEKV